MVYPIKTLYMIALYAGIFCILGVSIYFYDKIIEAKKKKAMGGVNARKKR